MLSTRTNTFTHLVRFLTPRAVRLSKAGTDCCRGCEMSGSLATLRSDIEALQARCSTLRRSLGHTVPSDAEAKAALLAATRGEQAEVADAAVAGDMEVRFTLTINWKERR